ncbi:hypothetical protein F-VV10_0236 [Faustovirus]|nr:hypothetical protein F-VV10_0236 [Faustovirus]
MDGIYVVECKDGNYLIEKSKSAHNLNIHPLRRSSLDCAYSIDYIVINDAPIDDINDIDAAQLISHVNIDITISGDTTLKFSDLVVKLNGPVINRNYVPEGGSTWPQLTASGRISAIKVEYRFADTSTYVASNNYRFYLREVDIRGVAPSKCAIM